MIHITATGNTEVPAYLILEELGYEVERRYLNSDSEIWIARQGEEEFSAGSAIEVLGLCLMRQKRGEDWKANDEQINTYLKKFYPDALPLEEK